MVSTGPYMFETNDLGKSFALVRNPNWDQATDPNRKPLPDRIEVALNVNSDDIDNRLISGDLDVSIEGSGVGPAAQGRILADQNLKANTDSALVARSWFTARERRASRPWTTSTAARPCSTRSTGPATSAPTAAPPAATSPPTSCRRSSRAPSSSTSTRRRQHR